MINYLFSASGDKWVSDIKFTRTNFIKDYLTTAPYLILVFKQTYSYLPDGTKKIHYYNDMSVSIASGILLTAIHVNIVIYWSSNIY